MTSSNTEVEFLAANKMYAERFNTVTCLDARIDPFAHLGLKEGDAQIIRNAGGNARQALRSVIVSQRLFGTREIALFHHTDCGLLTYTTPDLQKMVKDSDPSNSALNQVDQIDFLDLVDAGLEGSVKNDVQFLKENPLVLPETKVTGWVFEAETGRQVV